MLWKIKRHNINDATLTYKSNRDNKHNTVHFHTTELYYQSVLKARQGCVLGTNTGTSLYTVSGHDCDQVAEIKTVHYMEKQ